MTVTHDLLLRSSLNLVMGEANILTPSGAALEQEQSPLVMHIASRGGKTALTLTDEW